jgi:hypothetical protein
MAIHRKKIAAKITLRDQARMQNLYHGHRAMRPPTDQDFRLNSLRFSRLLDSVRPMRSLYAEGLLDGGLLQSRESRASSRREVGVGRNRTRGATVSRFASTTAASRHPPEP